MWIGDRIKELDLVRGVKHEYRPCGSVGCEIIFDTLDDWVNFLEWLKANWVSFGNYGDITSFSWNGENKSIFIDFK